MATAMAMCEPLSTEHQQDKLCNLSSLQQTIEGINYNKNQQKSNNRREIC